MSEPRGEGDAAAEEAPQVGPASESSAEPEPAPVEPEAAPVATPVAEPEPTIAPPTAEPPTPEVAAVEVESVLPGYHRGGFQRLPTAPVDVTSQSAPADPDGDQPEPVLQWALPQPAPPARGLAAWALAFAVLALIASFFVGFGFPLGIVAIVAGVLALRRPLESRPVAVWAIVLGALSILYSAGWLFFAARSAGLIG